MARSRIYRRIVVRCRLRCPLSPLRFQPDAQGRPRGWPAGIQLRRLRAALRARRGLPASRAGGEGGGLGDVCGGEQFERRRPGVGLQRSGGAGVGEKKGAWTALSQLGERSMAAGWRAVGPVKLRRRCPAMRCGLTGGPGTGPKGRERRIWTAVAREAGGSRWADFEVGDRSEEPFLRLHERLPEAGLYRSDAYQVYLGWFPPGAARGRKGGSGELERRACPRESGGLHSAWRSKLDRLIRRTKGCAKSLEMLVYSPALVCWRQWVKSNIRAR